MLGIKPKILTTHTITPGVCQIPIIKCMNVYHERLPKGLILYFPKASYQSACKWLYKYKYFET